jgi:hypothetical protein
MNDPTPRTVRRTVTTTRRVRREITVHLSPPRAARLGVRLVLAGLKAFPSGRLVPLTLRTKPKSTSETVVREEVLRDEERRDAVTRDLTEEPEASDRQAD